MTGIADFAHQTGAFTPASPIHWTSGSELRGSSGEAALSFSIPNGNTHAAAPSTHGSPPSRLRQGGTMVLQSMLVIVDGSKIPAYDRAAVHPRGRPSADQAIGKTNSASRPGACQTGDYADRAVGRTSWGAHEAFDRHQASVTRRDQSPSGIFIHPDALNDG